MLKVTVEPTKSQMCSKLPDVGGNIRKLSTGQENYPFFMKLKKDK